jgi:GT2 family glycosyltransferase
MNFAVGMVIQDRWDLTCQTLDSLSRSPQNFHLFLVDNGSSPENAVRLVDYVKTSSLPIQHLILIKKLNIAKAFNLTLYLTRNYKYRIKMDNDILISHPDNNFIERLRLSVATRPMKKLQRRPSLGVVSILPIAPTLNKPNLINQILHEVSSYREFGKPYLYAACLMITQECFERVGYFNERLERRIDIDYCHRAHDAGFALGYVKNYWVIHLGAGKSTEGRDQVRARYKQALAQARKKSTDTIWASTPFATDTKIIDLRQETEEQHRK